jgi:type II pantothenate kinase
LDDLLEGGAREEIPTIHHVTLFRESVVRAFELGDPYRGVKQKETDTALERLLSNPSQWGLGERGSKGRCEPPRILLQLLSGNLFDLGSALTQKAFREGRMDLEAAKNSVWDRLMEIDAAGSRELARHGWRNWFSEDKPVDARRLLILVDNAGADFVLGILPLASCLAEEWDEVVLAANSHPSSNDITLDEAQEVLERAGSLLGQLLERGRLRIVGTGTGTPGIDLAHVGESFNAIAKNSGTVILEGQGRGVETTWDARFQVPVLRLAVLKDPEVAAAIGRRLWDPLVVRQLPGLQAGAPKRHQDR